MKKILIKHVVAHILFLVPFGASAGTGTTPPQFPTPDHYAKAICYTAEGGTDIDYTYFS